MEQLFVERKFEINYPIVIDQEAVKKIHDIFKKRNCKVTLEFDNKGNATRQIIENIDDLPKIDFPKDNPINKIKISAYSESLGKVMACIKFEETGVYNFISLFIRKNVAVDVALTTNEDYKFEHIKSEIESVIMECKSDNIFLYRISPFSLALFYSIMIGWIYGNFCKECNFTTIMLMIVCFTFAITFWMENILYKMLPYVTVLIGGGEKAYKNRQSKVIFIITGIVLPVIINLITEFITKN